MCIKKLNLVLWSALALVACNGGSGSQGETTAPQKNDSQEMVPNPRILGNAFKTSSKSLKAGSTDPEFLDVNKGVRIGYGYDPITRKVLSIPMNSEDFAYTLGTKDKSPFEIPSACVMVNYADELGKVLSSSNATLLNADIKGAVNVGLAKAGVAASFNRETLDDNSSLSVSKLFGASVKCQVDTNVAPDIVADKSDNYQYMQEALMKAAPGLATSIAEIRASKTLAARQAAIKSFYEKYGTYMVSGITLGQVAVRKIDMTQAMSTSETKIAGAAAANYSSPFSSVEASAKYAAADKVDAKSWKISVKEGFFPADNQLNDVITRLQAEFDTMKSGGIIDFSNLKPNPVDKPDIVTPTVPTIEVDKDLKVNYAKVNTDYKNIANLVADIQSTLADIGTSKDEKILHYTQLAEDVQMVIDLNTELTQDDKLSYLSSANYDNYMSKYGTLIGKWKSNKLAASCTQMVAALGEDNQTAIASLETKINATILDANKAQSSEKAAADEQKNKDDQASKDKVKEGVTLSKYIATKFVATYQNDGSGYADKYNNSKDAASKEAIYTDWMASKLDNNTTTAKEFLANKLKWTQEWTAKYGSEPAVPLYVTKEEADKYLQQQSALKTTLKTGNDEDLYRDKGVLDFKVTAWAKIFPELTQTFGIDDSAELNENLVASAVKNYIKYYLYLSQMSALDGSLENMRYQEEGVYKQLNKLQVDLNYALDNSQSNVVFLGTMYDLDQEGDVDSLIQKINEVKTSSPMLKSEWYKVAKELFAKGLIGEFGSFLGVKPEYPNKMSGFGLLTQPMNKIPTVAEMDAMEVINPYKSGVRVIFQKLSNLLLNNAQNNSMKELKGVLEVKKAAKNLNLDDPEYINSYMFDSQHDVARLALNDVPPDTPTNLGGAMPAVLGSTKLVNGVINSLGLVDSSGHIIGANPGSTNIGDTYNSATLTYNLNLNTNIGNDKNPAYELTLNQGNGLVSEINLKGSKADERAWYNKLLLGASFSSNSDGNLSVCSNDYDIDPNARFCLNQSNDVKVYKRFDGASGWQYGYEVLKSEISGIYLGNLSQVYLQSLQEDYSGYNADYNWPNANGLPANGTSTIALYKYKLVITPINKNVISSMSNLLKGNPNRQSPFLPTYNYWSL